MGFGVALAMSSLLALSLAAFLISNTIAISVTQRRHEIGILRALGALRRDVRGLFLVESGLMGAIGSALGVLLGLQFARLLLVGMTRAVSVLYLRVQGRGRPARLERPPPRIDVWSGHLAHRSGPAGPSRVGDDAH